MKYEQTIVKVPKRLIDHIHRYVSLPLYLDDSEYQGEDNTIIVATVKCSNGYEIDIKCCGCQSEASWTEAVLFNENGTELCCTECSDEILGEWKLEYDDTVYSVVIEEEIKLECPLGGDETDDCADCAYAGDYHFINGECVRREENE